MIGGRGNAVCAAPGWRAAMMASVLGCLAAAGCSPSTAASGSAEPPTAQTVTAGTVTAVLPTTVTSTAPGTVVAAPPEPTAEPPAADGACPYLSDDQVADINGQHTGQTQLVAVAPYPICVFYRSDGGSLATVRIIQADSPQAAVAAVDQHVPIENSDPASQPPGWSGGSMVTESGSVYAVSKGSIAVVAESNQQQSIKGRQMVAAVVGSLGL